MAEEKFEKAIIAKLIDEGWTYNQTLSGCNDDKLYDHWREILNRNNQIKLEGRPLSDQEFNVLKLELNKNKTPYDAQLVLAGAGNVGSLPLTRDDGTQLEIEIFYGNEIAGGHSEYEVVNQITFPNLPNSLSHKRRVDILLLINGLPVAHIEEKDEALQNQWGAFEQFRKYDGDGMYLGLMSFVQVQFILSQHSAHYLARPKNIDSYNRDFVFGWRDDNGKDVTNAMEFIHQAMGIPSLHRLVTTNMIPDAANDNLMVMRSYQIQATRAILDRMKEMEQNHFVEREGGYIWHTTGSGKTVTSFKVSQLLASLPRVRHVLFIVDRVDLVNQTYENFKSYAYATFENRIKTVDGRQLKKEITNQISNIFLITVQGLDNAVKSGLNSDQRMVIIMDEAHRSSNGDAVKRIKKAMPQTTWFGFTGTPNFYSDELRDIKTSREISTYDIFGKRLHRYTIKDAIGDGNVLGFDISYYKTAVETKGELNYTEKELEKMVYSKTVYRKSVVEDIIKNWNDNASGPIINGERKKNQFQAMLAVSGKQAAVEYYNLFKEMGSDLKVTMTFSRNESNGIGSSDLQEALKTAMSDYQKMFDTINFIEDPNSERTFLNDITKRLARKRPYNRGNPDDILNLVIVSDQLLTGFDSKYINIIYLDKILAEGLLIQAMSRTNRIFDKNAKPYGKVRFYRKGELMQEKVDQALVIYTKGGNDTIEDAKKRASKKATKGLVSSNIIAPDFSKTIEEITPKISRLKDLSGDDFSQEPLGLKQQSEFVTLSAEVNNEVQKLVQRGYQLGSEVEQKDDDGNSTGKTVKLDIESPSQLSALQARMNDVNEKLPEQQQLDFSDVYVSLEKFASEIVDYDYLVELLNNYIDDNSPENRAAIEDHILSLNEDRKEQIKQVMDDIDNGLIKEHFTKESLSETLNTLYSEKQELKLWRWASKKGYNTDDIFEAYELFMPGVELNDNPKLKELLNQLGTKYGFDFFTRYEFENEIMEEFNKTAR